MSAAFRLVLPEDPLGGGRDLVGPARRAYERHRYGASLNAIHLPPWEDLPTDEQVPWCTPVWADLEDDWEELRERFFEFEKRLRLGDDEYARQQERDAAAQANADSETGW